MTTPIAQGPVDVNVRPQTCGECPHAEWTRTPTGRIKKQTHGRCGKASELLEFYSHRKVAPCICLNPPHLTAVWPDYDATNCPMWHNADVTGLAPAQEITK